MRCFALPKQAFSSRSDLWKSCRAWCRANCASNLARGSMQEAGPDQVDDAGAVGPTKRRHSPGHACVTLEGNDSSKRHCDDPGVIGVSQEAGLIRCMDCQSMKGLSAFSGRVRNSINHHGQNCSSPSRRTPWVCKSCTEARSGSLLKLCSGCNSECTVGVTCSSSQAAKPAKTRLCFKCQETSSQQRTQEVRFLVGTGEAL